MFRRSTGWPPYVRVNAVTLEVLWSTTVTAPVSFPYIPNYLTFRELPLFTVLFDRVRDEGQEADVTLVDGNGIPPSTASRKCFRLRRRRSDADHRNRQETSVRDGESRQPPGSPAEARQASGGAGRRRSTVRRAQQTVFCLTGASSRSLGDDRDCFEDTDVPAASSAHLSRRSAQPDGGESHQTLKSGVAQSARVPTIVNLRVLPTP